MPSCESKKCRTYSFPEDSLYRCTTVTFWNASCNRSPEPSSRLTAGAGKGADHGKYPPIAEMGIRQCSADNLRADPRASFQLHQPDTPRSSTRDFGPMAVVANAINPAVFRKAGALGALANRLQ